MATRKSRKRPAADAAGVSSPVEQMLLAALERGGDATETGRYLVTFKEGAGEEGLRSLGAQGMRVADARDFRGQAATLEAAGDADAFLFPEIGVALIGGQAAAERSMALGVEEAAESPFETVEPESFAFNGDYGGVGAPAAIGRAREGHDVDVPGGQLRSAARILEAIAREVDGMGQPAAAVEEEALVLGATWGLKVCRVPLSTRSGAGIKVAVLGTGMDLGHPDFAGRSITGQTFVGQPVQDLNGHGTHMIGTACGPRAPAGNIPRYGIGFQTSIFVGKVLGNTGSGTTSSVLVGINWALANGCQVIFVPLSMGTGPLASFTAAGQAALNKGSLMIAGSSSSGSIVGAPANSPTIMSVAALDQHLTPASFSPSGKIDIAAPGRDVFSAWSRPLRYNTISGLATAGAHVAGCAALWAQTSPNLRGQALWNRLRETARPLPFPATRVGAGLVQAPA